VSHQRDYVYLTALAALFFLPFLGGVHLFDWDEVNFAECAREMLRTGDYLQPRIDYAPFWEKPPLFLWMQSASMHVFGVNEFAARFPNVVCGWITLLGVYYLGSRLHDRLFGWIWALAWLGSVLPHLYFRSGIIDPWFNLFTFISICGFIGFRWQFFVRQSVSGWWHKYQYLLLGGFVLGLAILTKGPTALLIVVLTLGAYWAKRKFRHTKNLVKHTLLFSVAAGVVAMVWFGIETAVNGAWFVEQFVRYQARLFSTPDAGHTGFVGYHVVVLLIGCFPISILALVNLWGDRQSEAELMESDPLKGCKRSDFATWMQLLFWVILILFTLVKTKIVHYSSMCYFPLTYLGALTIWRQVLWPQSIRWIGIAVGIIGVLLGSVVLLVPYVGQHMEWVRPLLERDHFAQQNLNVQVDWEWWRGLPGAVLAVTAIIGGWYWWRYKAWSAAQVWFVGGAIFMSTALMSLIGHIELYSQHAAIEFYEQKAHEDCYVYPVGFKSYAHLFYTNKRPVPADSLQSDDFEVLLRQPSSKPVYIVAKWTDPVHPPAFEGFRELYRKQGFVFFERTAR
jgi:4-amino-4-deoxy-L-arabinose transferase-like glycosyltransferase